MQSPIKLISTDFDGTVFAEFESPPIAPAIEELLRELQLRGIKWAINTGRDLSSLMESIGRSRIRLKPDFLVVVERHVYFRSGPSYRAARDWNQVCDEAHREVFQQVRRDLPRLQGWIMERFQATVYEDDYSPFCLIADNNDNCDQIYAFLEDYCGTVPNLAVVRNDVYARFSHSDYNKGTALGEIARRLGLTAAETLAAGDHFNDVPMLDPRFAQTLVAPSNAIEIVQAIVRRHGGFVSSHPCGIGTAEGIRRAICAEYGTSA